jgi:hypothetical protein
MKVEEAVVAAETEKVAAVRAVPEGVVAAGSYQESLFVAVPE